MDAAALRVVTSSQSVEWSTPQWLFDELDREFSFLLDVCATPENAKCPRFYSPETDGLHQDWVGNAQALCIESAGVMPPAVWGNFPYGRVIGKWVAKAAEESKKGLTVVCLLPARTCTKWWHRYIWDKTTHKPRPDVEVRFLEGRLRFGGSKNSAPFPSVLVVFRGR